MKKIILALSIALISSTSFCADIKGKSTIEKVKVFLTGAQVERTASANIIEGRNRIVFSGISAKLDEKSIQVRFEGSFKLMSVSTELDFNIFKGTTGRIGVLNDSLRIIDEVIQNYKDIISAINSEKDLLNKNKDLSGANSTLTVDEIEKAANFYRKRMEKVNKELTQNKSSINNLNKSKWLIQNKLNVLNFRESTRSNQVILIIDSKSAQKIDLTLEYFVSGCGWEPNYNLHAEDLSGNIRMEYKAKVFNDTGNDWDNIAMTLSTGNPNLSATFPELSPWFLNYQNYVSNQSGSKRKTKNEAYMIPENNMDWDMVVSQNEEKVAQIQQKISDESGYYNSIPVANDKRNIYLENKPKSNIVYRTIEVSHLSMEFEIKEKYSIPADKKPYMVDIKEHNLQGSFKYVAVPKMERDAFLLAQIPGWEKLDLVPGPTRVYFDGTYVGESWIDTRNVEDTLKLSFGRDSKIFVTKDLLSEFSNKKVVGNNRKDSYTYEITIKNTRNIAIDIDLHDQIPISQDSDISVTIEEISASKQEIETGILTWKVNLNPNESKKFRVAFTIKYPKHEKVQVKSFRTISAPSF